MQLYKITNEYENVFNQIDENGEMTQDMIDTLDSLQLDFENKAVCVATYIKNLEAEEAAISQAMDDMKTRKLRLSKQVESMSDYLQFNLQRLSITEIKSCPYFKIRLKQCPASVDVFDEDAIPAEYWREKVVTTVDKIRLKEVLNCGVEVPGASIQRKIKLEIK
ncbi:MAG TPA: siphovirus Gp157 family protein [Rummeliibacillus sp.]|nr:siphovirus Gp157 family protein [Rummeliibacillus sp.]